MKNHLHHKLVFAFLTSISLLSAESPHNQGQPIAQVLQQLKPFIEKAMQKTGVPGVAVAVVYRDKVVYLDGFGIRKAGSGEPVDDRTVFQLASLSKPIASTIVAALVG